LNIERYYMGIFFLSYRLRELQIYVIATWKSWRYSYALVRVDLVCWFVLSRIFSTPFFMLAASLYTHYQIYRTFFVHIPVISNLQSLVSGIWIGVIILTNE
jgi:hypothetical protein